MDMAKGKDIRPWMRCLTCQGAVDIAEDNFRKFFVGQPITCPACKQAIDWWAVASREISDNFMFTQAFGLIGARTTWFNFTMKPNERMVYKLIDYGIPVEAKILSVNYTPQGTVQGGRSSWPVEMHGNVPTLKTSRQEMCLYPVPHPGESPQDSEILAVVTWVNHSELDQALSNLVVAFEAYVNGDYSAVLMPANVAVESSLAIALNNYLPAFMSADRADKFLKKAEYSYQLNAVLPLIVGLKKLPNLPDHIRGQLNNLRDLRNEVAHLGKTKKQLTKEACAQLLCASVFGFSYTTHLRDWLGIAD